MPPERDQSHTAVPPSKSGSENVTASARASRTAQEEEATDGSVKSGGIDAKGKGAKKKQQGAKADDKARLTTEKQSVFNVIEQEMNNLNDIGHDIWRYAEPPGKEHQSCKRIVDFLKHKGFRLNPVCNDFDTAFRAEFGSGEVGGKAHPNIAFLCEYSADPETGHSKGHNLVTATCLAAAIGLQRVIGFSKKPLGKVTVIGCPSNSTRTAKKNMLDGGCFNSIDFMVTAYPANFTCLQPTFLASMKLNVNFRGRTTGLLHPWEGANPMNGLVLTQQALAAHRQTFAEGWTINCVIPCAKGEPCGDKDKASIAYEMRSPTNQGIKVLNEKLHLCLEGAAQASGCKFDESVNIQPIVPNVKMPDFVEVYRRNAKLNGCTFHDERTNMMMDPDDTSFISHFVPTFKLYYYAGTSAALGSDEFTRYCGSTNAEYMNIVQGKSLAMMATDLFMDQEAMQNIMKYHEQQTSITKETLFTNDVRKSK